MTDYGAITKQSNPLSGLPKLFSCLLAAGGVSVALFVFMQKLISQPAPVLPETEFSGFVELFKPLPQQHIEDIPPPPQQQLTEPKPQQQALNVLTQANTSILLPDTFALSSNANFQGLSGTGTGAGFEVVQELLEDFGEDTQQGFIEITPFATRRPNIPDVAFENQLNGWVLVIFNVSPQGRTRNIKVLDASPKGIFEQDVVRAISYWHYDVQDLIKNGRDLVLTQKIQLDWQHYHQNLPYEDQ